MNERERRVPTPSGARSGIGKLGIALAVLLLFLLLLPELVRWALVEYLPDTGIGEVAIEDVDLNLFSGKAGVRGVRISREGASTLELDRLTIDFSWLKLLLARLQVDRIVAQGVRFAATEKGEGNWDVIVPLPAGGAEPAPADDSGPALEWPKVLIREIAVKQAEVAIESGPVSGLLVVDTLAVQNLSTWSETPVVVEVAAAWQQAPISISATLNPWLDRPTGAGTLILKKMPFAGIGLPEGGSLAGCLDTDIKIAADMTGGRLHLTLGGGVSIEQLQTRYRDVQLAHRQLNWQGDVDLTVATGGQSKLAYRVKGNLNSEGLAIDDLDQQLELLSWDSLALAGFVVDETTSVSFDELTVLGIKALGAGIGDAGGAGAGEPDQSENEFYTDEIRLGGFDLKEARQLRIGQVAVVGGKYQVIITPEGRFRVASILTSLSERLSKAGSQQRAGESSGPRAEVKAGEQQAMSEVVVDEQLAAEGDDSREGADPFRIKLDALEVSGDTLVELHDLRFDVPVREEFYIESLVLKDLDQISPQRQSTLSVKGKIGEFSTVDIGGKFQLFADTITAHAAGTLKAVELPPLSPYTEAYLGYHISRGQYDLDFDLAIADGEINLQNTLHLRQLKVKSVDPDKPQPMEKQLKAPLGLALDMLRDGKDNITLNVPIKGRLDDPSVNVSSVINNALGNAIKSGTTSYLKFALQPYGAVLMAAEFVGDQINAVKLDPLVFDPGSDTLPDAQVDYLEKLLALLQERPAVELTLCGQSNQEDKQVLLRKHQRAESVVDTEVLKLAERRAKKVKRFFTEKGVDSQRLLLCQASYLAEGQRGVQLKM